MSDFSLRGLGIALITPFNINLSVDYQSLGKLIDRAIAGAADYLVVLGTTGEAATLSAEERAEVREFVVNHVAGQLPLVLGLGGNCTASLTEEIKSTDLSSFSAILSVVPFYNKPSQQGLYLHYASLAKVSPLPLVLYNVPGRTGCNMTADTTIRLAKDYSNIIGIKEASGQVTQAEAILRACPEGFQLVSGDDALAFPYICMGACGVISVIGNAYPASFGKLVHSALAGDLKTAREMQHMFDGMYKHLFTDGNPAGVKALLSHMGLIDNTLRLPLTPCSEPVSTLIRQAMETLPND